MWNPIAFSPHWESKKKLKGSILPFVRMLMGVRDIIYTQVIRKEQSNIYDDGNMLSTMIFLTDLIRLIRATWTEKGKRQITCSHISRTAKVPVYVSIFTPSYMVWLQRYSAHCYHVWNVKSVVGHSRVRIERNLIETNHKPFSVI